MVWVVMLSFVLAKLLDYWLGSELVHLSFICCLDYFVLTLHKTVGHYFLLL